MEEDYKKRIETLKNAVNYYQSEYQNVVNVCGSELKKKNDELKLLKVKLGECISLLSVDGNNTKDKVKSILMEIVYGK